LAFWRSNKEAEEETDGEEEVPEEEAQNSTDLSGAADESLSMMDTSAISEDQVTGQLLSRSPRQVRFQLSGDRENRTSPEAGTATQQKYVPYVAPLPPSSLRQSGSLYSDPLAKVSEYLDTVVLPRGGECTDVEALGLSMLIQSSVNRTLSLMFSITR
jgi:hypothetical protein